MNFFLEFIGSYGGTGRKKILVCGLDHKWVIQLIRVTLQSGFLTQIGKKLSLAFWMRKKSDDIVPYEVSIDPIAVLGILNH